MRSYDFRKFPHFVGLAAVTPEWKHAIRFEDTLSESADMTGGQTQVYLATQVVAGAKSDLTAGSREKAAGKLKVKEGSKSDVTKPF